MAMRNGHSFTSRLEVTPENPSGSDYGNYVTKVHEVRFTGRSPDRCIFYFFNNRVGGGSNNYTGQIPSEDFQELAKVMMAADPERAIKAFGSAMQQFEMLTNIVSDDAA
jgi:hypothetical protein